MRTLKKACTPRPSVFDSTRRDTVLSLNNLLRGQIAADEFFQENHLTQGMRLLLENGFKRLEGHSDQGVFRLTQAMGGGKTHNLLAFGLLARHPEFRASVMKTFHKSDATLGAVRVLGFSGRESDAQYGIWGALAEQVGKRDLLKDYYTPLRAPGQSAWVNLLKGEPTLILLDELPPYFENAKTVAIGNSDLSVATAAALANLFVAVTEDLPNVCLVITDLTASYGQGSQQIVQALDNLQKEANRVAMDLEPVRMNSDEFYHILRKRIFETLPLQKEIDDIAHAYSKALREARQMDITSQSPEQFAAQIAESYPFHPGIRDLYARFKENQNFQQTRGLIRLMRVVVSNLFRDSSADPYLITAHTLDLNHGDTLSEIRTINPALESAIVHDIASHGSAIAELQDQNRNSADAQDIAKLLLVSSLATVPGAIRGLVLPEIAAYLCEPGRDVSAFKQALMDFETDAWYLHRLSDGKLYFRDVQNLNAKLNSMAKSFIREQSLKELKDYLLRLYSPQNRWCYQDVLALPGVDEIKLDQDRVKLVISFPHNDGLNPDLKAFFDTTTYQNRVCFLTGQRNFDALLDIARQHKAIQAILDELVTEKTPDKDPQMVQARDLRDKIQSRLLMAVRETFTTLYFPNKNGLSNADLLMKYSANDFNGEAQIVSTLDEAGKYTDDVAGDTFVKKIEQRIFTQKSMPWGDVKKRAATNVGWQWHRPDALDKLKGDCISKGIWREDGGFVEKGPFPKQASDLNISPLGRDDVTGRVKLRLTPINADEIYAEVGADATTASQKVSGKDYETDALVVSFLAVDSTGKHPQGTPKTFQNSITLKSRQQRVGNEIRVELTAAPKAQIRYTTDGSNPKTYGGVYDTPFIIKAGTQVVQAIAERDGIVSEVHSMRVTWDKTQPEFTVDPLKPVTWQRALQLSNTKDTFEFLSRIRKLNAQAIGGGIMITSSANNVAWFEANFGEGIALGADQVEQVINVLRDVVRDGIVTLRVDKLRFERGQGLLDYANETRSDLKPSEVKQ